MGYYVEKPFRIPATARSFEGFRRWTRSSRFPEQGRIDYIGGHIEVDMSPEDLHKHGLVKTTIAGVLFDRIMLRELGDVYIDRARVAVPGPKLSVEPDVVVVLWESIDSGRVREIPRKIKRPESYIELEGSVDLVVEVISDSSVGKDRTLLPPQYAAAGVPELWLVDVRRGLRFEVHVLEGEGYRLLAADADGWLRSPL
ncbi:MAG: Uma2 family endonuclease, partial [Thermoanaerobaculia bacterium]